MLNKLLLKSFFSLNNIINKFFKLAKIIKESNNKDIINILKKA